MARKTRKEKTVRQESAETLPVSPTEISKKTILKAVLGILAVTFVVLHPALTNSFVLWDDPEYTFENPLLKDFSFAKVFSLSTYYMGNYHPLTILWLHWEEVLFPKGDPSVFNGFSPFWFHLNNLILHLLNTALVFYVIYELLDKKGWKTAGVTALLFGIHPMHVESVAWVSEIKDVLYTAFFLGAILMYIRYSKIKSIGLYAVTLVFFILSNLAKAQAVTLPVLFFLIDYYQGRKFDKPAIFEKIPFLAGSVFFGIVAIKAQGAESAINENYYSSFSSIFYGSYGLLIYMYKLFLPVNLSGAHPYPTTPLQALPGYFYIMPVIVAGIAFSLYKTIKFSKDYLFGFLFYMFSISVMLKLVPVGDTIIAERYSYVPYIGLFFIFGQLYSRFSEAGKWKNAANYSLLAVTLVLSVMTWQRTQVWKNSFTFWGDVTEKYPNYWRGYNCVGQEYAKIGDHEKALEYYTLACEKDAWAPPVPYMLRGALYVDQIKNYDLAIADFNKVLTFPNRNDPSQLDARHNLGLAYYKKGDFTNALKVLDEAIQIAPNHPKGYYFKGLVYAAMRNYEQAELAYTNTIKVAPAYSAAYLNRGVLYTDNINQFDKGIADFRKVLQMEPNHRDATINIGICLYKKEMLNEAIQQYNLSLKMYPNEARIYYLRALVYVKANNFKLAHQDGIKAKQLGLNISDQTLNEWKAKW